MSLLRFGAAMTLLVLPWMLNHSLPPVSTFVNQTAAWGAWAMAILLLLIGSRGPSAALRGVVSAVLPMLLILLVLMLAAIASWLVHGLPASLASSAIASLAGAMLLLLAGSAFVAMGRSTDALRMLLIPILIAAVLSSLIAMLQIFHDQWTGNSLIATAPFSGRASGNLRQPNHLSSLALWGIVAAVWLRESSRLPRLVTWMAALTLVAGVVLTGSRTGVLGIVLLATWALFDRGLSIPTRRLLWSLPLAYAVGWWLFRWWASNSLGSAEAVDRIASGGDVSSARFAIWSNTIDLIQQHPLFGVGFGEFNFAWTLTPFPDRPTQFYDHTHNIVLQWLVEFGIPVGMLLTIALALTLWRCFAACRLRAGADGAGCRSAFVLILLIVLHSQLEYPLWYVHFLLPTMFAIGICLALRSREGGSVDAQPPMAFQALPLLQLGAVVMLVATAFVVHDYRKIVVIFTPPADASPLAQRIAEGRRSVFFAHHAHYAEATTAQAPAQVLAAFDSASHFLLDTRLMLAWAKAFDELGDQQRARHLADRLREFGNEASQSFFAVCAQAEPPPFQCMPASEPLDERAFR